MKKRTWEILYSKNFSDGRIITQDVLEQIVNSTTSKHRYPLAFGHFSALGISGDDFQSAGEVSNLRLVADVLIADIEMTPEVEQAYSEKKYMAWSAGISREVDIVDDAVKYGDWEFGHVALLGSTEAAFKDLSDITDNMTFSENGEEKICEIKKTENVVNFRKGNKEYLFFSAMGEEMNLEQMQNIEKQKQELKKMPEIKELEAKVKNFSSENEKMKKMIEKYEAEKKESANKIFSNKKDELEKITKEFGISEDTRNKIFSAHAKSEILFSAGKEINTDIAEAIISIFSEVKRRVEPGQEQEQEDYDNNYDLTEADFRK